MNDLGWPLCSENHKNNHSLKRGWWPVRYVKKQLGDGGVEGGLWYVVGSCVYEGCAIDCRGGGDRSDVEYQ